MRFVKVCLIILIALSLISGCNTNQNEEKNKEPISKKAELHDVWSYHGDSKNWDVDLSYKRVNDWVYDTRTITYKKPLKESIKIEYDFSLTSGSKLPFLSAVETLQPNRQIKRTTGGTGAAPTKRDIINFNIKWNGQDESILLKAK